ncbi:TIGR01777 family oxidoreductase [Denitrobaculum tricleocarpae]|uniref:TIGR01777 family protein n=1 Tax=Denitrobaculum tricleocarpae TaxID=2591009 RepID=A0A545TQU1_9PROT|nr:TIGR01777 family oxidoreductase [Denitrobaculum tricleocarpae]TQV79593.1 TIGR01777 family protein [Denitrobaculum tricleocarpae]
MQTALILFAIQGLIGAFDNLWHHEITEKLSSKPNARGELILHTIREFIYAVIFVGIAWFAWNGWWAILLMTLMAIEVVVTLWDFVIEDQTRKLPGFERILHTLLAINFGAILAFFLPVAVTWSAAETALTVVSYGPLSWIMTAYGVGVFGWALYDLWVVVRLSLPDWKRNPVLPGHKQEPLKVLITGATGFVGKVLVRALIARGDKPLVLARNPAKADYLFGPHAEVVEELDRIPPDHKIDAVVNLAGAPLLGGLWTKRRKEKLIASRVETTQGLIALLRRLEQKPEVLINGSAVGYYGRRDDELLRENAKPQDIFTSRLCKEWEQTAKQAEALGLRVCLLRIGLVFGRGGGAFPQLARPIKLGLGAIMGHGRQWMSWIHLQDLVGLILFVIDRKDVAGPINATAPVPVTNEDFTRKLARQARRPVFLRVPAFVLRTLLGELSDLFIAGQRVVPQRAEGYGYRFRWPDLEAALPNLMGSDVSSLEQGPEEDICWVYYDDACEICAGEIGHYRREALQQGLGIAFHGLSSGERALAGYGLNEADAKRRLYVYDGDGRLVSGIDAMAAIWARIPRYRWAARLVRRPVLHGAAELLYDAVAVPMLMLWNACRGRRNSGAGRKVIHG